MRSKPYLYILPYFILLIGGIDGAIKGPSEAWFIPDYLAVMAIIIFIAFSTMPKEEKENKARFNLAQSLALLGNAWVFVMTLGLFLYAGAEVSVLAGLPTWLRERHGLQKELLWGVWLLFLLSLVIGRFLRPVMLRLVIPRMLLLLSVLVSVAGILMLTLGSKLVAVIGILLSGLGFANVFPLIVTILLDHLPAKEPEVRSLMLLSVAGGAVMPPLMYWIAYAGGTGLGFVVPLFAMIYMLFLAIISKSE